MLGLSSIFSVQLFFYMYFATRPRPALTAVGNSTVTAALRCVSSEAKKTSYTM